MVDRRVWQVICILACTHSSRGTTSVCFPSACLPLFSLARKCPAAETSPAESTNILDKGVTASAKRSVSPTAFQATLPPLHHTVPRPQTWRTATAHPQAGTAASSLQARDRAAPMAQRRPQPRQSRRAGASPVLRRRPAMVTLSGHLRACCGRTLWKH